jgi:hypothetical protein
MSTFLIAGIPAITISLLIGILILEHHASRVVARKRSEQLKLWLSSQASAHDRASDGLRITAEQQRPHFR